MLLCGVFLIASSYSVFAFWGTVNCTSSAPQPSCILAILLSGWGLFHVIIFLFLLLSKTSVCCGREPCIFSTEKNISCNAHAQSISAPCDVPCGCRAAPLHISAHCSDQNIFTSWWFVRDPRHLFFNTIVYFQDDTVANTAPPCLKSSYFQLCLTQILLFKTCSCDSGFFPIPSREMFWLELCKK